MNHLENKTKHVASTMTGSVTETETKSVSCTENTDISQKSPLITKEAVTEMTDEELLQLYADSEGHRGKNFKEYMQCDFSYSHLTDVLQRRGYKYGWFKDTSSEQNSEAEIIIMKKTSAETMRQSYVIDSEIAKRWKSFNERVPYPSVTIGAALSRFLDDVENGCVKFVLEIHPM